VRLAIMQPYFFPYIGYFQLMNAVDQFVIYDNIQFTKKGWIHRNRILSEGKDVYISLSLKKDSDYLDICDRTLADDFEKANNKLLRRIESSYRKAPHFHDFFPVVEAVLSFPDRNLFRFVANSLQAVAAYLNIETTVIHSSDIGIDHSLHGQERVLSICKHLEAKTYINSSGGIELYSSDRFRDEGIDLKFLQPQLNAYDQKCTQFVSALSIIDVLMFNSCNQIFESLSDCELI